LEQSVDRGFGDKGWMETDSDLDSLHASQRYNALVQRM
jgi:hypothetical protein